MPERTTDAIIDSEFSSEKKNINTPTRRIVKLPPPNQGKYIQAENLNVSTISALKNGMSPSFIRPIIFHFLPLLTSVKEPSNNGLIPFFFLFITSSFFSFKKNHSKNKSAANLWPDPVHANNKKFMRDICDVFTIFFLFCLKGTIVHRPFYVLIFVFKKILSGGW